MTIVIKAPNPVPYDGKVTVFLGGSIDMGVAEDWQTRLSKDLSYFGDHVVLVGGSSQLVKRDFAPYATLAVRRGPCIRTFEIVSTPVTAKLGRPCATPRTLPGPPFPPDQQLAFHEPTGVQ